MKYCRLQGLPPDRMISEIVRRIPSGGMPIGIPIPLGGGSSSSTTDTNVAGGDNTVTPILPDTQSTIQTSSDDVHPSDMPNIETESPSALFGDAISTESPSKEGFSEYDKTDDYTSSRTNNIDDPDETSFSNESQDEEFNDGDNEHFEVEQSVGDDQDDGPIGFLKKVWDFFRGGD